MALVGSSRPMSRMKKIESKESVFRARRRILKYLVVNFLREEGCFQAAETFTKEAEISNEYEVCDNIDLDIILQEYCSYYMMKFNKQPTFCKKVEERSTPVQAAADSKRKNLKKSSSVAICEELEKSHEIEMPYSFTITQLTRESELESQKVAPIQLKTLAGFLSNANSEKKEIAETLYQDIIKGSLVKWNDVKGLDAAKSLLMESVVYPVKYPGVFTGILEPWRGILMHGPPGTGKTMLAKAVANESNCTFFNVSSSTVVNKWRGESEKIIKILFEMALYYSPSIIFVDEIESIASERDVANEHEASRRLKSQLLIELDGINSRDGMIFLLANTNLPWDIDSAMLRRLEKRIYIPLPDCGTRLCMFKTFLSSKNILIDPDVNLEVLATRTDGYSGSDIKIVCKEAVMAAVRKILPDLCNKGDSATKHRLTLMDIEMAISKTKPISKSLSEKHLKWQNERGSC